MTTTRRVWVATLALACASWTVEAHHSITAVYDSAQVVTLEAVVTEFHFVNPHPYLLVRGREGGSGESVVWHLEMDNLGELREVGLSGRSFSAGDQVLVTGSRSRTEPHSMYVRKLERRADGLEYEQVGFSPRVTYRRR